VRSDLDAIGVRHQSELSSLGRDLLRSWERFLAPLREQRFDLLQIGVGDGASLRTWREWFPEARLVGLDPRRLVLDPPIADCAVVHGNQIDLGALQPLVRDYRFRLVVDDGSHHPDDQVLTFQLLFPWLEADSVYICAGIGELKSVPGIQIEPSGETPEQPGDRPGRLADRVRRSADARDRRTGAAWFAELGRTVTGSERRDHPAFEQPMRKFIGRKTTGVFLLPGSILVTG
jgi:hypothetical protein